MFHSCFMRKGLAIGVIVVLISGITFSLAVAHSTAVTSVTATQSIAAPSIDLPLPNITVDTTAIANDQSDGHCDLYEALMAVFYANYGMGPTYHECTAKVAAMNIIAFSAVGGTITLPTSPS